GSKGLPDVPRGFGKVWRVISVNIWGGAGHAQRLSTGRTAGREWKRWRKSPQEENRQEVKTPNSFPRYCARIERRRRNLLHAARTGCIPSCGAVCRPARKWLKT